MNQYRCETCQYHKDAGQTNRIFGLYHCTKCDIILEPVFRDQICCTGCASHSDFQNQREKVLDEIDYACKKAAENWCDNDMHRDPFNSVRMWIRGLRQGKDGEL